MHVSLNLLRTGREFDGNVHHAKWSAWQRDLDQGDFGGISFLALGSLLQAGTSPVFIRLVCSEEQGSDSRSSFVTGFSLSLLLALSTALLRYNFIYHIIHPCKVYKK